MRNTVVALAAVASLAAAVSAHSEGIAITPQLGTPLGLGVDVTYRLSPHFNLRAGGSPPATAEIHNVKLGDLKYDLRPKIGGLNLLVDWHPFAGSFHISSGVVVRRDTWALEATSVSSYKLNGTSYAASDVGRLTGEIHFRNAIAPALLVGWGNAVRPGKHLGVVFDMGLAYVDGHFSLAADGPLAGNAAFQRDLAAEEHARTAEQPLALILKIGLSYQF